MQPPQNDKFLFISGCGEQCNNNKNKASVESGGGEKRINNDIGAVDASNSSMQTLSVL